MPVQRICAAALVALAGMHPAQATEGDLPAFEVVAREGRLLPERLAVPAGRRIKLIVRNQGKGPIEFENLSMRIEKVLAPGATSFVVLPPMQPGEYDFIDEFHMETGKLQLIVR
jgi:hypothetical protein